jgi:two-component sensor histidine kinase
MLFCLFFIFFVDAKSTNSDTMTQVSFFEDTEHVHTFESVVQETFQQKEDQIIRLGFTESTVWVKITINPANLDNDAVLILNSPLLDDITLSYFTKDGTQVQETLGIMYPQSRNQLGYFVPAFNIPVDQLQSNELLLRVNSRWTMSISPSVLSLETFHKEKTTFYFIAALLLGALICMAIYNLFLFFSLREFSYLLYVLALISTILTQGYLVGFFIRYLSPESPEFSFRIPVYVMATTCIFSTWFALEFLGLKKKDDWMYYILLVSIFIPLFTIGLEVLQLDYLSRKITVIENLLLAFIIYISSVYCLVKGKKIALYFNIAWTLYLIGVVLYGLNKVGVIPANQYTEYFAHVGSFIEVIVLSFALGHKYNLVRMEKEKLERQSREELEELVKIQTTELEASLEEKEVLLKEIHHRVKNNLQIVISLLDLQVASAKSSKNKQALVQSKSRVYSMSLIHQKLYQSNNFARINIKNYLEELFFYVKKTYTYIKSPIQYSVHIEEVELSLTQAVPLGLIVNELLTNSLKYGVQEGKKDNHIKLSVQLKKDHLELIVADSGEGFEAQEKGDIKSSLGLFLINSLNRQLRGKVERYFEAELFTTKLTFQLINS